MYFDHNGTEWTAAQLSTRTAANDLVYSCCRYRQNRQSKQIDFAGFFGKLVPLLMLINTLFWYYVAKIAGVFLVVQKIPRCAARCWSLRGGWVSRDPGPPARGSCPRPQRREGAPGGLPGRLAGRFQKLKDLCCLWILFSQQFCSKHLWAISSTSRLFPRALPLSNTAPNLLKTYSGYFPNGAMGADHCV